MNEHCHKMEFDSRVNDRTNQTTEEKIDMSNALDALDASSTPSFDDRPMSKVHLTADDNVYATGQQHTEQPESNNEGEIQKKGVCNCSIKNALRKLTGNDVNTKFAKPSILGKPVLQPHRNQFVVRQPTAFKSERPKISKERFASQVDVCNDLSKPVTTHYLPKRRESAPAKPHLHDLQLAHLGGNRRVEFSKMWFLDGFQLERHSPLAQQRYSPKYRYIVQSYKGRTQSLVAEKTDVSENRASRNFDLMIIKWCLLKITLQAPFLNVQMTFEQRSSSLVLHQMTSDHNRSELGIQDHSNEPSSSKLVPKVVP
ncbi:hypothetical protein Tco_0348604 [Tanacetum coccineum]